MLNQSLQVHYYVTLPNRTVSFSSVARVSVRNGLYEIDSNILSNLVPRAKCEVFIYSQDCARYGNTSQNELATAHVLPSYFVLASLQMILKQASPKLRIDLHASERLEQFSYMLIIQYKNWNNWDTNVGLKHTKRLATIVFIFLEPLHL